MTLTRMARHVLAAAALAFALAMGTAPAAATVAAAAPASCDSLASLALTSGKVTAAEVVAPGAFKAPASGDEDAPRPPASLFATLPAFCRIAATLTPSSDSEIRIEVWLPAAGWNGKLQVVGNGGFSGSISYPALARGVAQGYATASTDTGHQGGRASFAIGHPEKLKDFGYRAVHETTVNAKTITAALYGSGAKYSYWNGCSSGGKQGLKEAQKFPGDFDGIVAGAPANNWIHQKAANMNIQKIVHRDADSAIPSSKYPVVHKAMLEACDALDGVKDGVLENPSVCRFDPAALACKGGDEPTCLTAKQVETARAIYAPAVNPRTGVEVFPGIPRGTELSWDTPAGPEPRFTQYDHWAYVVFENPKWDYRTIDLDRDVALAEKIDAEGAQIVATDPNLQPFFARGGKLLMYHGWADPNITPFNSVNYYNSVVKQVGAEQAKQSIRLFMVPGMGHCSGGEGTSSFDMLAALSRWVERGEAPAMIPAARMRNGAVDRTRPLCPYPQQARYKGAGSTDSIDSFACETPGGR